MKRLDISLQVKMTIYRADPSDVDTIELELTKKSGKNLGLGFFTSNPRGLLVTDIVRIIWKTFRDDFMLT